MAKGYPGNLDRIDLGIIEELEADGRQSAADLARKLGTSRRHLGNKLQRLMDQGTLRVVGFVDPFVVGYTIQVMIGVSISAKQMPAAIQKLKGFEEVQLLFAAAGRYDLILDAVFRNIGELSLFLTNRLSTVPGMESTETIILLERHKRSFSFLASYPNIRKQTHAIVETTPLDLKIAGELEVDGRQSIADLGRKLGANRNWLAKRLQRLIDTGIIEIIGIADPRSLGLETFAWIGLNVSAKRIRAVVQKLKGIHNVKLLVTTTGRYDIVIETVFQNTDELRRFLTYDMASIPGIKKTEAMIVIGIHKASWSFFTSRDIFAKHNTLPNENTQN